MRQEVVFRQSKRRLLRQQAVADSYVGAWQSRRGDYKDWRRRKLQMQWERDFRSELVRNKDVLDFGCGGGALSFVLVDLGARSVIGLDLMEESIDLARSQLKGEPIEFRVANNDYEIDLENHSVDVITCFDVLEHVMRIDDIVREWKRVLRPDGRILISWQPWFHPYAHHLQGYIPLPWVHLLLNSRERIEVCAKIVDEPGVKVSFWDRDSDGRRINRFREALTDYDPERKTFLNHLTMLEFERLISRVGLLVESRVFTPFQGPLPVRLVSRFVSAVPFIREFSIANVAYQLTRNPDATQ